MTFLRLYNSLLYLKNTVLLFKYHSMAAVSSQARMKLMINPLSWCTDMSVSNKNPSWLESGRVLITMALLYISILCLVTVGSSVEVVPEDQPRVIHAGTTFGLRNYSSILTVPNGEKFGIWMWSELCPENFYATGFSLRVTISSTLSLFSLNCMSSSLSVLHFCVCSYNSLHRSSLTSMAVMIRLWTESVSSASKMKTAASSTAWSLILDSEFLNNLLGN